MTTGQEIKKLQSLIKKATFDDSADREVALHCVEKLALAAKPIKGDIRRIHEAISDATVSIDVSTCDEDAGNRLFGTIFGVQSDSRGGVNLLVCDVRPNFTVLKPKPAAVSVPAALATLRAERKAAM